MRIASTVLLHARAWVFLLLIDTPAPGNRGCGVGRKAAMKKIIKVKDSDGSIREVDLNDPSNFHETKGVGSDAEMVFMGILILILLCKLFYHWVTGTP